jgi:hypothetical protein
VVLIYDPEGIDCMHLVMEQVVRVAGFPLHEGAKGHLLVAWAMMGRASHLLCFDDAVRHADIGQHRRSVTLSIEGGRVVDLRDDGVWRVE